MSPTVPSTNRQGVPYRRRAVNCRYGMCYAGARSDFCPGYWRLLSVLQEQEGGQKRRSRVGYHHGNLTFMCYRCDSLADTDPGGTFAIFLNDDDEFRCGCSGEKICRLGGNRPCVLAKVGMRHRRQVCQVQGKRAARYNERMSTVLEGVVVSLAVESKPPVFSEGISASGG